MRIIRTPMIPWIPTSIGGYNPSIKNNTQESKGFIEVRVEDPEVLNSIRNLDSPMLFYDNYCRLCYRFAKAIWRLSRGRIAAVGMYSKQAMWLRSLIDPRIYSSVSWFIVPGRDLVYGGRASIIPIIKEILAGLVKGGSNAFTDPIPTTCSEIIPCSGVKGFIYRTIHIIIKSHKIRIINYRETR